MNLPLFLLGVMVTSIGLATCASLPSPSTQEDSSQSESVTESSSSSSDKIPDLIAALRAMAPLVLSLGTTENQTEKPIEPTEPIASASSHEQMYMTGSETFNKLMKCPCHGYQLEELGVKEYYPVDYGHDTVNHEYVHGHGGDLGYGHEHVQGGGWSGGEYVEAPGIKSNLQIIGESTGTALGEILHLLTALPGYQLTALEPLATALSGSTAIAMNNVAKLAHTASKIVPSTTSVKGKVVKKVAGKLGKLSGRLVGKVSKKVSSVAAAKMKFTNTLPWVFDVLNHMTDRMADNIGHLVDYM